MRINDGVAYLKTRILSPRVGLLWMLLFVCTAPVTSFSMPYVAIAITLFILTFRLWDDLADLAHDQEHYPDRLLIRTPDLGTFHLIRWILLALLSGLLGAVTGKPWLLAFLLGLVAILLATYSITGGLSALRPTRLALVLAKYPAFVLLLSVDPGAPMTLILAIVAYLFPLLDEVRGSGPAVLLPASLLLGLAASAWLFLFTR